MQESQLHHDEEQEEAYRTFGNEKVLQYVPQADGTQRSEVAFPWRLEGQTGIEFRGVVQRLGLRSPKPGMGVRIPPPLPELSAHEGAGKCRVRPARGIEGTERQASRSGE